MKCTVWNIETKIRTSGCTYRLDLKVKWWPILLFCPPHNITLRLFLQWLLPSSSGRDFEAFYEDVEARKGGTGREEGRWPKSKRGVAKQQSSLRILTA
jgi:hypothetical protein